MHMKMEQTKCSETSAYKIQMPGNYPEENIKQPRELFPMDYTVQKETGIGCTVATTISYRT